MEELEFDVVENPQPRPKVFCYKIKSPSGDSQNVAVIAMAATDAKERLKSVLSPEAELEFLVVCDAIMQV